MYLTYNQYVKANQGKFFCVVLIFEAVFEYMRYFCVLL